MEILDSYLRTSRPDFYSIAPNLQTFIEAINQFYETKEASDFDEYFEFENIKDFSKKFYVE